MFRSVLRSRKVFTVILSSRRWCKSLPQSGELSELTIEDPERSPYTKEDVERLRDKSRLSEHIKTKYIKKELYTLTDYDYTLDNLRKCYGTYGNNSGLNPGLCWPTPEELVLKTEYDALAYKPLQEMVENIKRKKEDAVNARRKKEQAVDENMKKLLKLNKELQERAAKKAASAEAQRLKKEQAIEEIREKLGYHIDEHDPRFREMIERRQEQLKKAAKDAKKKKLKADKIEYLKQLASQTESVKTKKASKKDDSDDEE